MLELGSLDASEARGAALKAMEAAMHKEIGEDDRAAVRGGAVVVERANVVGGGAGMNAAALLCSCSKVKGAGGGRRTGRPLGAALW